MSVNSLNDEQSASELGRIGLVWLLIPILCVLVLSLNFHELWLIYDLAVFVIFFHFISSNDKVLTLAQVFALVVTLGYFTVIVIHSGHVEMGLLSVLDTLKHLAYLTLLILVVRSSNQYRVEKFSRVLYSILFVLFLMQLFLVLVQFRMGIFFDNIAGTFGRGGSHALGYLSVLFVAASVVQNKRRFFLLVTIALSLLMNILAENAGFVVLLAIMLGMLYLPRLSLGKVVKPANLLIFVMTLLLGYVVSGVSLYSERTFGEVIVGRLNVFESSAGPMLESGNVGRGSSFSLASDLGGWFGHGPGAYSDIYLLEGYDSSSVEGKQINISEFTHLLAESGYVGYGLTILVFSAFLVQLFRTMKYKLLSIGLFVVCTQYTAVLMNESHFFLLFLTLFYLAVYESRVCNQHIPHVAKA